MATEKERAYQRAYYLAHKDRILARTNARGKRWHADNKEKSAQASRNYHRKNSAKIATRKKKQRALTKEAQRAYAQKYHAEKAEQRNARSRAWHAANRERVSHRHAKWAKENPHICAERTRRRDAVKLLATPLWADRAKIAAIYEQAARLTRETGVRHEVDHIYPLQSKFGCGLHCEANLQILTKIKNISKGNKWPDIQEAA